MTTYTKFSVPTVWLSKYWSSKKLKFGKHSSSILKLNQLKKHLFISTTKLSFKMGVKWISFGRNSDMLPSIMIIWEVSTIRNWMTWTFNLSNSLLIGKGEVHCKTILLHSIYKSLSLRLTTILIKKIQVWDLPLPNISPKLSQPNNPNRATLLTNSLILMSSLDNLPFRAISSENGKRQFKLIEENQKP